MDPLVGDQRPLLVDRLLRHRDMRRDRDALEPAHALRQRLQHPHRGHPAIRHDPDRLPAEVGRLVPPEEDQRVQHVLDRPGDRPVVGRRADDQPVGPAHLVQQPRQRRRVVLQLPVGAEHRQIQVVDRRQLRLAAVLPRALQRRLQRQQAPRLLARRPADAEDAQRTPRLVRLLVEGRPLDPELVVGVHRGIGRVVDQLARRGLGGGGLHLAVTVLAKRVVHAGSILDWYGTGSHPLLVISIPHVASSAPSRAERPRRPDFVGGDPGGWSPHRPKVDIIPAETRLPDMPLRGMGGSVRLASLAQDRRCEGPPLRWRNPAPSS